MEKVFEQFGQTLSERLSQAVWGGADHVLGQLGSVLGMSDVIQQVLVRIIQHTCARGQRRLGLALM